MFLLPETSSLYPLLKKMWINQQNLHTREVNNSYWDRVLAVLLGLMMLTTGAVALWKKMSLKIKKNKERVESVEANQEDTKGFSYLTSRL